MKRTRKDILIANLKEWEKELATNKNGMQRYAERAIKLLTAEIKKRWPEYRSKVIQ